MLLAGEEGFEPVVAVAARSKARIGLHAGVGELECSGQPGAAVPQGGETENARSRRRMRGPAKAGRPAGRTIAMSAMCHLLFW
jgi:hypothetical protein